MRDPASVVRSVGGVATRQQLIAAGIDGYAITRAVRNGSVRRVRQARYVVPETSHAAVVAARVGGRLAGPTAAQSYGLWGGFSRIIHVVVGDHSSRLRTAVPPSFTTSVWSDRPRARIRLHWMRDGAVPELGPECWRVDLATALRQTVRWCDQETALACLDSALTKLHITRPVLLGMFAREPARSRRLAALATVGAESGIESLACRRLRRLGLSIVQQAEVSGAGRVDMVIDGWLVVEVDGRTYHQDPDAFEEDRRRDAELVARGYTVIRLSYLRVASDWAWCERVVLAALAQR
ncbi:type IV toxin-antitoxin system AbiEi family antitoxin domain-containing protein [Leifsonia sp. H3M29-4]|uniref:type IV toxin-antitoxin system AbiEi family antitoxin domain-containing protein n=1 Tax=Salinibacterium metalliresistens TaxID=3031321 RepID=UPI0023DC918B|nr:type IV toxin-antitoxin system AbiEi family antitoxin domain-containing protein [Salinibacterium metalliresistens]MDF1478184.1 type IV toxin-antitoxin system AbiEi family antitoxin domain-containing protein [Salinibacterium metalliresistens]